MECARGVKGVGRTAYVVTVVSNGQKHQRHSKTKNGERVWEGTFPLSLAESVRKERTEVSEF